MAIKLDALPPRIISTVLSGIQPHYAEFKLALYARCLSHAKVKLSEAGAPPKKPRPRARWAVGDEPPPANSQTKSQTLLQSGVTIPSTSEISKILLQEPLQEPE